MKRLAMLVSLALIAALTLSFLLQPKRMKDPIVIPIHIEGNVLTVEVAITQQQHRRGLMGRKELPPNHGMLFVFDRPQIVCMWMKDTPIPLSVAFLDARGVVLDIADMQPYSHDLHCSSEEASYAIETHRGFFRANDIKPGSRASWLPDTTFYSSTTQYR